MAFLADLSQFYDSLPNWGRGAISVLAILLAALVVKWVVNGWANKAMTRSRHVDDTARGFIIRSISIGIWIFAFVLILGAVGVDTAALLGGLAIGGFVIGFALKDTLGNLAAGLMLVIYRPFNVGDTVTIGGESGDVLQVGMALTTLKAADGRIITTPNGNVLGNTILNHTREPIRRADVVVGIGYNDDIDMAIRAIMDALQADERVLSEPAPSVRITNLGDSAVGLQVRPWVSTENFWQAKADFNAVVKSALDAANVAIPYPQQEVHLVSNDA